MNRREFVAMAPAFPIATVTASLTLKEEGKAPVDLDVSVLKVQPGDTLVLRSTVLLTMAQKDYIKAQVETLFSGVKAMVLDRDLQIEGVLRGPA
jgi:hypothetical protein